MNPKLALDLSIILRRHFILTQEIEDEVVAEIMEALISKDACIVCDGTGVIGDNTAIGGSVVSCPKCDSEEGAYEKN